MKSKKSSWKLIELKVIKAFDSFLFLPLLSIKCYSTEQIFTCHLLRCINQQRKKRVLEILNVFFSFSCLFFCLIRSYFKSAQNGKTFYYSYTVFYRSFPFWYGSQFFFFFKKQLETTGSILLHVETRTKILLFTRTETNFFHQKNSVYFRISYWSRLCCQEWTYFNSCYRL